MFRSALTICLFVFITWGCKKNHKDACPSEVFEYYFSNNASVDTLSVPPGSASAFLVARKVSGTKRVFNYTDSYNVCPEMIDGGSFQQLIFEVDPGGRYFKLAGADLEAAMCYYQNGNLLYSPSAYIPGGSIEGTMINDKKWQVSLHLTLKNNQAINKSAIFTIR